MEGALKLMQAERDENTCRKDFTRSEAVAIGKAIEDLEKPKAKQRQASALKKGNAPVVENFHHGEAQGKTRDKVAEALGVSGRTYEKAKHVVEAANEDPGLFADVKEDMDRTGKVEPAYQEVKRRRSQDEVVKEWRQQPGETAKQWHQRLPQVAETDKKGRKKIFAKLRLESQLAAHREFTRSEKRERFDIPSESDAFYKLLMRRREQWPEKLRREFIPTARACLERIESDDNKG